MGVVYGRDAGSGEPFGSRMVAAKATVTRVPPLEIEITEWSRCVMAFVPF